MYKGLFRTDFFNEEKPTIEMHGWVEPSLYNNGETEIYINGIRILPQDSFKLGPSGVEMYSTINIKFPDTGKNDVRVSYTLIEKPCSK